MKRVFDFDPLTGETTYYEYDHLSKKVTLETVQNVSPYLERNKASAGDEDFKKRGIKESWWKVASIPNAVIMQWRQEGVNVFKKDHWPAVRRKLNDPEWRYLRASLGRL